MASKQFAYKVFESYTSPRRLKSLYKDHVFNGKARGRDGVKPDSLLSGIDPVVSAISREMRNGTYRFTTYRELLKSKGSFKHPRVISIPTAKDRIVLKTVAQLLLAIFPECASQRPQPLVQKLKIALRTGSYDSFIRIDIKDFYPSIDHALLLKALRTRIHKKEILELIESAISTNTLGDRARRSRKRETRGVPQGLAISNILAEIFLRDFDEAMERQFGNGYFRYVDDILILCNASDKTELIGDLPSLLSNMGLIVHDLMEPGSKSRTGSLGEPIEYLGYVFTGNKVSVRQSSIDSIETSLARIFVQYQKSLKEKPKDPLWQKARLDECIWRLNLRISGCIYEAKPRGWLNYFSQMNNLSLLKARDASVIRLSKRFGVPSSLKPKTFIRTYWHINRPDATSSRYIPTLDRMSISDMKWILEVVFHYPKKELKRDRDVLLHYKFEIAKVVSDLEQDVRMVS